MMPKLLNVVIENLKVDQYKVDIAIKLLKWTCRFSRPAVCFSGGKDSLVVLDLIAKIPELREKILILSDDPIMPEEYYDYCERILEKYNFKNVHWLRDYIRPEDWNYRIEKTKDVVLCCYHLKILPVQRFILENKIEALIVAIRGDEHQERQKEKYVSIRKTPHYKIFRVHPILSWKLSDVWAYITENNLEINPLYLKGYTSLQCMPCLKRLPVEFRDVKELIEYSLKHGDRQVRLEEKEVKMHILRKLGYF